MPITIKPPTSQESAHYAQNIIQIICAFAVGYFVHWLTSRRERKGAIDVRRREFLAFMEIWKHEIGRTYLVSGGFENKESAFSDVVSTFKANARNIRADFPASKRKEFDDLCVAVVGRQHRSIYGPDLCGKAQKDMDNLIAFVEKN